MRWQEAPVSKVKYSQYAQDVYGTWDIIWDQSNSNLVEFVARRGNELAYVHYVPNSLDKMSEESRRREVAWHFDFYDNVMDFKSFVECKDDARLKKLVV